MRKKEKRALLFIALIPPKPLRGRIAELKFAFAQKYESRHALNAPPHITLVPPFMADSLEVEQLVRDLEGLAGKEHEFELMICDYGAFKPRVIYLDVQEHEKAGSLRQKLLSRVMPERENIRGKLHITLATRDLSKAMFHRAWKDSRNLSFSESFHVDRFYLLKHDGKNWQMYHEFTFKKGAS